MGTVLERFLVRTLIELQEVHVIISPVTIL